MDPLHPTVDPRQRRRSSLLRWASLPTRPPRRLLLVLLLPSIAFVLLLLHLYPSSSLHLTVAEQYQSLDDRLASFLAMPVHTVDQIYPANHRNCPPSIYERESSFMHQNEWAAAWTEFDESRM